MKTNTPPPSAPFFDRLAVGIARRVIDYRWLVIVAAVVGAFAIGSGARFLEFANNYRAFFSSENPELTAFESFQNTYTKNDNFLFVLEPADGEAFSGPTLAAVEELTAAAWRIPYAIRVDSVSNFQHTYGVDDDLIVEDLIRDGSSMAASERDRRKAIALAEPLMRNQLITEDGTVTAVNVVLQYPQASLAEVPAAVTHARGLRDQLEVDYPHLAVSLTGVSMLNNAFSESGMTDMGTLVPGMFGVIVVLAFLILRSLAGTIATVAVIMLSTTVGMGVAGFTGIKLTPISGAAPIVILTLAIADSIHILVSLRTAMREGLEKTAAIVEALRLNLLPVTITSLTTVIGFLSLNFSDSPPFWHLGNITAVGIVAALVFSITLLPALMSILPYRVAAAKDRSAGERAMVKLADFVIARPRSVLLVLGLATVVLISFIPRTEFNDQWTKYFDQRIEFRTETEQALKHFGMYPIEYSVGAGAPGSVASPEYLSHLESLTEFMRAQPEVAHVYSITDIMQRLNMNLHGDDRAYYRIPQDRDLAAQYLLLYEMSLPYGLDLNDRINIDKSASRVTATLGDVDSIQTKRFLTAVDDWMQANLPEHMHAPATGPQVMFTFIADRNVANMIFGTTFAVLAIAVVLMFALRSAGLGLLSLIPNGLPILATFGAWAILVGQVGFSVATVASISLGIIVDDTVHLLAKYVRARRERGGSVAESIRYAFASVGIAIVVNTFILSAGFLVLVTSAFKVNADMGLLTTLAIVLALVLDFLLLPALLLVLDRSTTGRDAAALPRLPKPAAGAAVVMAGLVGLFGQVEASEVTATRGDTDTERRGFEVAARSDRSDRGFGDSEVVLAMVLRNAAGEESTRRLRITTLEVADESVGDKSLVLFDEPRDVEGTALLSHARILDPDDQWLYLPALKRTKRISSANKSGPFVGSEFAFEDFTSLELNKFDYNWLREETKNGLPMDVVERTPRYENSGYTRQVAWIDQTDYQLRQVQFFDRRGDLLKTLTLSEYRLYDGIWRAQRLSMTNHQTGKSTDLIYDEYQFGTGLADDDFVRGRLTRLR